MCGCLLRSPTGDLAHNPGMCPDWESNRRPFGLQAGTQSSEPHQPGRIGFLFPPKTHWKTEILAIMRVAYILFWLLVFLFFWFNVYDASLL